MLDKHSYQQNWFEIDWKREIEGIERYKGRERDIEKYKKRGMKRGRELDRNGVKKIEGERNNWDKERIDKEEKTAIHTIC